MATASREKVKILLCMSLMQLENRGKQLDTRPPEDLSKQSHEVRSGNNPSSP